jgi:hypothetical protein
MRTDCEDNYNYDDDDINMNEIINSVVLVRQ